MIPYFTQLLDTLNDTLEKLDEKTFKLLVNESTQTLKDGKKIIVSGLGKNIPICDKFVGSMVSLGLQASFLHTNSAIHGDLGIVNKDDLVIILTKSGETIESIYLAEYLKKKETNLWLLTFNPKSTLSDRISKKIILHLEHEGDMWNIMPNNSTTLNLIILQALAMCIAVKMDIKLDNFKENHPGGYIGECLKNAK